MDSAGNNADDFRDHFRRCPFKTVRAVHRNEFQAVSVGNHPSAPSVTVRRIFRSGNQDHAGKTRESPRQFLRCALQIFPCRRHGRAHGNHNHRISVGVGVDIRHSGAFRMFFPKRVSLRQTARHLQVKIDTDSMPCRPFRQNIQPFPEFHRILS